MCAARGVALGVGARRANVPFAFRRLPGPLAARVAGRIARPLAIARAGPAQSPFAFLAEHAPLHAPVQRPSQRPEHCPWQIPREPPRIAAGGDFARVDSTSQAPWQLASACAFTWHCGGVAVARTEIPCAQNAVDPGRSAAQRPFARPPGSFSCRTPAAIAPRSMRHPLASLGRLGLDLKRHAPEILGGLHESADLRVHLSVGGVLRSQGRRRFRRAPGMRPRRAPETAAVCPAVRKHRQARENQRDQNKMSVSHVGYEGFRERGAESTRKAREIRPDFWHGAFVFDVAHRVSIADPAAHLLEVKTTVRLASGSPLPSPLTLFMPVWTPGSYLVREYARHVEGFGLGRRPRHSGRKIRKNAWEVTHAGARVVEVRVPRLRQRPQRAHEPRRHDPRLLERSRDLPRPRGRPRCRSAGHRRPPRRVERRNGSRREPAAKQPARDVRRQNVRRALRRAVRMRQAPRAIVRSARLTPQAGGMGQPRRTHRRLGQARRRHPHDRRNRGGAHGRRAEAARRPAVPELLVPVARHASRTGRTRAPLVGHADGQAGVVPVAQRLPRRPLARGARILPPVERETCSPRGARPLPLRGRELHASSVVVRGSDELLRLAHAALASSAPPPNT